jgi:hypothetical protein
MKRALAICIALASLIGIVHAQIFFSSDKRERGGRLVGGDYYLLSTPGVISQEGLFVGRIRAINTDEKGKKRASETSFTAICSAPGQIGILYEGSSSIEPVDVNEAVPSQAERQTYDLWCLVCRRKKQLGN